MKTDTLLTISAFVFGLLVLILILPFLPVLFLVFGAYWMRDRIRGWRVEAYGREGVAYSERRNGQWVGISLRESNIDGLRSEISVPSEEAWEMFPQWVRGRRVEIMRRVKSQYPPKRNRIYLNDDIN